MKSFIIPCAGYDLAADWYEADRATVLLVLTGYSSAKKNYRDLIPKLMEQANVSVLAMDYSGHGKSPFELSEISPAQNFLEVVTAFDWIKADHHDKKIYVMGISYGGFMATQLTKYRAFDKLVLRAPAIYQPQDFYSKWKDIDRDYNRDVFMKSEAVREHPLLARASGFQGKTLVVVHEHDEIVPKQTTDAYINAFGADVYVAKGFTHVFKEINDQTKIDKYLNFVASWLTKD